MSATMSHKQQMRMKAYLKERSHFSFLQGKSHEKLSEYLVNEVWETCTKDIKSKPPQSLRYWWAGWCDHILDGIWKNEVEFLYLIFGHRFSVKRSDRYKKLVDVVPPSIYTHPELSSCGYYVWKRDIKPFTRMEEVDGPIMSFWVKNGVFYFTIKYDENKPNFMGSDPVKMDKNSIVDKAVEIAKNNKVHLTNIADVSLINIFDLGGDVHETQNS